MGRRKKDGTITQPWKQRRVAFMISDATHTIKPISIFMPVRVKERGPDKTVFEGPIETMWEVVQRRMNINTERFSPTWDLVGVLYANDEQDHFGRIDWLEQSETRVVEEGRDQVQREAGADRIAVE